MQIENVIGKRVKSPADETIFLRFPYSEKTETLPAGKPSGKITSFIINKGNGFYQIEDKNYIQDKDRLNLVDDTAEDESGFLTGAFYAISDWLRNTGTEAEKQAGFIGEGFKKSVGEVKTGFFNINSAVKPILILLIILYGLSIVKPIITKYTGE